MTTLGFESGSRDQAKRYRRFRAASQSLTHEGVVEAMSRPNVRRFAAIVHDQDYETATHCHVVFWLDDARTLGTAANMLDVPAQLVRPVVGQRGDPYSFARAVRYLTHESPSEQAKGKHLYRDEDVFASTGYDWRADVDALRAREGHVIPLADRVRLEVLRGARSAMSVFEEYPQLFIRHRAEFELLDDHAISRNYASTALRQARLEERRRRIVEG